jgi:CDP-diacylglycerol--glycerol-3-phosphate 3-phosphatidyltransferase
VVVDGLRMYSATKQQIVAANFYGKLKTVCQMFAIIVIFIFFNSTQTNDIL